MPDINITINVDGADAEVETSKDDKKKVKIVKKKTKTGSMSVLKMPPMMDNTAKCPMGLLDMMGV